MLNINVVTVFSAAQRKEMKAKFQHDRRYNAMLERVGNEVQRSTRDYKMYNTRVCLRHHQSKTLPIARTTTPVNNTIIATKPTTDLSSSPQNIKLNKIPLLPPPGCLSSSSPSC